MGQGQKYFQILPGGICSCGLGLDQPGRKSPYEELYHWMAAAPAQ